MYKFIGKKGNYYELDIKFNSNCPDSEKNGKTGPGSCGSMLSSDISNSQLSFSFQDTPKRKAFRIKNRGDNTTQKDLWNMALEHPVEAGFKDKSDVEQTMKYLNNFEKLFGLHYDSFEDDTNTLKSGFYIHGFTMDNYANIDRKAARRLSKETDIPEESIDTVQRIGMFQPWLSTYAGQQVIQSLSRTFDIPLNDHEKETIQTSLKDKKTISKKDIKTDYKVNKFSFYDRPITDNEMDTLVKLVYQDTQKILKDAGIKSLKVYRGGAEGNVLGHYSLSKELAEQFDKNNIIEKIIPAEQVWSIPLAGFGVPAQLEVLTLKNVPKKI